VDRQHHAERYYARGRRLEEEARAWFTAENVAALIARVNESAARGAATRARRYPAPEEVARLAPRKIGRNDPCTCGSAKKVKACCGANGHAAILAPTTSR